MLQKTIRNPYRIFVRIPDLGKKDKLSVPKETGRDLAGIFGWMDIINGTQRLGYLVSLGSGRKIPYRVMSLDYVLFVPSRLLIWKRQYGRAGMIDRRKREDFEWKQEGLVMSPECLIRGRYKLVSMPRTFLVRPFDNNQTRSRILPRVF